MPPPHRRGASRRRRRAAVLGVATGEGAAERPLDVVTGIVLDASPHLLVLGTAGGEIRLAMSGTTTVWHGGRGGLAALRPGRSVIVRLKDGVPGTDTTARVAPRNAIGIDGGPRGPSAPRNTISGDTTAPETAATRNTIGTETTAQGTAATRNTIGADTTAPGASATRNAIGGDTIAPAAAATRNTIGGNGTAGGTATPRTLRSAFGVDRVWVGIGRVTGTILACGRDAVEVDMGPHRGRAHVMIPPRALERVLVRHPRLEPGYLLDVICVESPGGPQAVRPGTSQPGYRADDLAAPEVGAPVPGVLRGTATWFGGLGHPGVDAADGAAYPAVDSEGDAGGCGDAPSGCVAFPYLSLGSEVVVQNECERRAAAVPVVECGCVASRYCDRCVECDTSPRGRLLELTPAAFVRLGGDLEAGCFNATVRPGRAAAW